MQTKMTENAVIILLNKNGKFVRKKSKSQS